MIQFYLHGSEGTHYRDLYEGAGQFKYNPSTATAKEDAERKMMALENVLPDVGVRKLVGVGEPIQVIVGKAKFSHRWKRV